MKRIALLLVLFNFQFARAQVRIVDPVSFDYTKVDSIALNLPKKQYKTYTELVQPLTKHFQTDHEKFRVLFRWITDNIAYSESNLMSDANVVIRKKKGVCIGYSTLLKEMCNSAGIECEIIVGHAKTNISDIGKKLNETDHAWNAVKLYGSWYLVDVTWAAGYYDLGKKKNVKSFSELYFLTEPSAFIMNHYPEEEKWQLLDKAIGKSEFSQKHVCYSGYFEKHIVDLQPQKGMIKMKRKDTLEFTFQSDLEINKATIELGNDQYIFRPPVVKMENGYRISQKFERPGVYELKLFLNGEYVAAFKLEVLD